MFRLQTSVQSVPILQSLLKRMEIKDVDSAAARKITMVSSQETISMSGFWLVIIAISSISRLLFYSQTVALITMR